MSKGLAALQTAKDCVAFGAHKRTVQYVTGLPSTFILRTVFDSCGGAKRGRPPYSDEFLPRATRGVKASVSSFAARYELLCLDGYLPAQALLAAYRHYCDVSGAPRLSFDEAFYVCCCLDGIWARRTRSLQLVNCRRCERRHLQPYGSPDTPFCAFCGPRRPRSSRMNAVTKPPALDRPTSAFDAGVTMLALRRDLTSLGAHTTVIEALFSELETVPPSMRPPAPSGCVHRGLPVPLARWNEYLATVRRVQFSMVVASYENLRGNGFYPLDSLVAAFKHVSSKFKRDARLTFDRAFEVTSLTDARWGVRIPALELMDCADCSGRFLASLQDARRPQCPFCLLIRCPSQYRSAECFQAPVARLEAGFLLEAAS